MADEDELDTPLIADLYKPPALLPIAQLKDSLLYTIETYPVTIIVGETGSGKTTQIPQFLTHAGWTSDGSIIAVTQVGSSASLSRNMCLLLLKSRAGLLLRALPRESQKR
jgi:ATP-dependent RNA helicase DDX35